MRDQHERMWITAKKERMCISRMETSHIVNCISMLKRIDNPNPKWKKKMERKIRQFEREIELRAG